jgi:hypothetical protein
VFSASSIPHVLGLSIPHRQSPIQFGRRSILEHKFVSVN